MADTVLNAPLVIAKALRANNEQYIQLSKSTGVIDDDQVRTMMAVNDARQHALTAFVGSPAPYSILSALLDPLGGIELFKTAGPGDPARPGAQSLNDMEATRKATFVRNGGAVDSLVTPTKPLTPVQIATAASPAGVNATQGDNEATRVTRKSRPAHHQGATFDDYGGVKALAVSPTVVKLSDGSYIELRCNHCGGNTSWAHSTFIGGVRGFQSHLRQVHSGNGLKPKDVLESCKFRDVSADEAESIIKGESKIESVVCAGQVTVGRNVEYVGNAPAGQGIVKRAGATVESIAAAAAAAAASAAASGTVQTSGTPKRKRDFFAPHLENCPVVVQAPTADGSERFVELRCDLCHGNGSFGSGKLLSGVKGFKMHFHLIHKQSLSTSEVLQRCTHRDVPQLEVQQIQAGNVGIGFVRCEGSPNVRPKESYKDFNANTRA